VSSISGAQIQYAGGGAGGTFNGGSIGLASAGGGGAGASGGGNGFTAIANTGSGGGGGSFAGAGGSPAYTGGSGGSGIVVIRYPSYLAPATSTTGSPEMYVAGAWRVYKFVASGTITF
jgi:hypothetical protein